MQTYARTIQKWNECDWESSRLILRRKHKRFSEKYTNIESAWCVSRKNKISKRNHGTESSRTYLWWYIQCVPQPIGSNMVAIDCINIWLWAFVWARYRETLSTHVERCACVCPPICDNKNSSSMYCVCVCVFHVTPMTTNS